MAQDQASQTSKNPAQVRSILEEGNQRFCAAQGVERAFLDEVNATRGGQWPLAAIVGCIDSRVPPEVVFDQGIGDLFCARVAGNFVNEDILGSLEFACKVAGSRLIVVLGHEHCGAVKGACDGVELGNLTAMLSRISPALTATAEPAGADQRTSANAAFVHDVAVNNVKLTVSKILQDSPVLADMQKEGSIDVVGAMYDIETGKVTFLD